MPIYLIIDPGTSISNTIILVKYVSILGMAAVHVHNLLSKIIRFANGFYKSFLSAC